MRYLSGLHFFLMRNFQLTDSNASTSHCILELLSRIKNVEEEQNEDHKTMLACFDALIKRIEKLEDDQNDTYFEAAKAIVDNYKTTPNLEKVRSSLVKHVATKIRTYDNASVIDCSKAVIYEVIEWLHSEMWPEAAQELEQEVEQ
jgi:hypothetical protein